MTAPNPQSVADNPETKARNPKDFKKATFEISKTTPAGTLVSSRRALPDQPERQIYSCLRLEHLEGTSFKSDQPLLLPNVWDVGGARLAELLGAKAVATTSAAVVWSLGYPDGNKLPVERQAQLASDLVKAVKVPVSIDMEAGYSADLSDEGVVPRWFLGIIREFRSVAGVWLGLEFALWVS